MNIWIKKLKKKSPLKQHPYFVSLKDGSLSKELFICGQRDFYHAVVDFSLPMMKLAARLPNYEQRWLILNNVNEEHGFGNMKKTHGFSFLSLLSALSAAPPKIFPHPCVQIFNHTLHSICTQGPWTEAVACLGIIEDRFTEISQEIATAALAHGWLNTENLIHYKTHAALDIQHAQDFYNLIEPYWATEKESICNGLELGNYLFLELYRQLYDLYNHSTS